MLIERELNERDLAHAKARLDAWLAEVDDDRLLSRLAAERPLHPLLWGYRLGVGSMSALLALSIASLAIPLLSRDLARVLAELDATIALPLPVALMLVSYAVGAVGVASRWLAVRRAAHSPMHDWERHEHATLMREVKRFQGQVRATRERELGAMA